MKISPRVSFTLAGGLLHSSLRRFFSSSLRWVSIVAIWAVFSGHSAYAGDNLQVVATSGSDLTIAGSYVSGGTPGTSTSIEFANTTYSGTNFSVNTSLTINALGDLDTTQAITINNSGTSGPSVLTISGDAFANSIPGEGGFLTVASGANLTFAAGSGANTLTLSFNSTSQGVLNNGILNIAAAVTMGGDNFALSGSGTTTISGAISGSGQNNGGNSNGDTIIMNGTGLLVLSGTSTYTGGTVLNSGTTNITGSVGADAVAVNLSETGGVLNLNNLNALSGTTGTVTVSGGALNENTNNALSGNLALDLTGATASVVLSNSNNYTGSTTVSSGTLTLSAAGAVANTTGAVAVNGQAGVLLGNASNGLTGTNSLAVSNGVAILSYDNNFTGATTLSASGILQLSNTNALADSALSYSSGGAAILRLRQDTSAFFNTSGTTTLTGATAVTIDVNELTGGGTAGSELSLGPITNASGNATTLNITGGNGYILGLGNITMLNNFTLNPTTASVAVLSATANANSRTLTLSGTATGNTIGAINLIGTSEVLQKSGVGTWTLTGSNNIGSGSLTVGNGTLSLNFGASGAPLVNMINPAATLTLSSGGVLNITGGSGLSNVQAFASTTLNDGASAVVATQGGATLITGSLGAITRNSGATIDFTLPTTGSIVTTSTNTAAGILGGWATVSGTTWAVTGASGANPVTGLGTYQETSVALNVPASYSGSNVDVNSSQSPTAAITPNSLRFNTAAGETLTLFATGANVVSSGGILVTANVGANTSTITSGTLAGAAGTGGDLVIIQNNTSGGLAISSVIANNGASATILTKSGLGTLTLSAGNTYTGATYLNGGITNISADTSLGTAPGSVNATQLNINGGTLQFAGSFALAATRGITFLTNGGYIDTVGFTDTYAGAISGSTYFTKIGTGTLSLSGASGFTGNMIIANGIVSGSAATSFGSGTVTIGDITGSNNATMNASASATFSTNILLGIGNTGTNSITSSPAATAVTFSGGITLGTGTLTVAPAAGNSITLSNTIVGSGGLVLNAGTGSVDLSSANSTFTGGIVVNSGTFVIGASASNANGVITKGPLGTGVLTLNNGAAVSGAGIYTNSLVFGGQNITFVNTGGYGNPLNFTVTNNNVAVPAPTVTTVAGANWTTAGGGYANIGENVAFTPSAGVSLTSSGNGTLVLAGNNSFGSGSVVVNSGILQLGFAHAGGYNSGQNNTAPTNTGVTNWQVNGPGTLQVEEGGTPLATGTVTLNNGGIWSVLGENGGLTFNDTIEVTGSGGSININNPGTSDNNDQLTISKVIFAGTSGALFTVYDVGSGSQTGSQYWTVSQNSILQNNTTIDVYSQALENAYINFSAGISDNSSVSGSASSLTVSGTGGASVGNLVIGAASTYTGSTFISGSGQLYAAATNAIPDTAVIIDSTSVLHLDNAPTSNNTTYSQTILGLSGTGTVTDDTLTGGNTLTINDSNAAHTYTFSGTITNATGGGLALLKSGESTEILTGANNYHGNTSITGGVLQAQDGVGLSGSSLLIFSGSDGVLQSSGTFTRALGSMTGTNQVEWAASSSGGFAAKGGTLTVAIGGTASPTALTWGATNFVGTTQTLDFGSSTADSLVNFENAIAFASTGVATVQVTGTAPAELSGVLSGATSSVNLTLIGGGKLILAGANTYTGLTLIQSGTLDASSVVVTAGASNLGNATSSIGLGTSGAQGTFEYAGSSATMTRGFNLNGNGGIAIDNAGQTLGVTGGISLNSGNQLSVSGPGNLTVSGSPITGAGTSGVTMNGTGTLALIGTNTYTGTTIINSGIVSVNALNSTEDSLGVVSNSNPPPVTINGGTLQYTGVGGATSRDFTIGASGATLDASGSGPIDFNNTNAFVGFSGTSSTTLTLTGTNTGQNTFAIGLSDPSPGQLSLVKNGTGTWLVTGAGPGNSNSGTTIINAGTLQVDYLDITNSIYNPQPLGESASLVLGGSSTVGTLQYINDGAGSPGNTLYQNVTVGAGGGIISNASGSAMTLAGTLTKANTTLTLTSGTFDVTGQLTGGSSANFNSDLDVNGAFVNVSNSNNNYTGPTLVYSGGTIQDGVGNALPVGTVLTTGSSGDGAVTNTFDLAGYSQTVAALNSAGGGTNIVTNSGGSLSTLTLTGDNSDGTTVNGNFSGRIQDGNGQTAVTVSGGTQTLSGANSYTGATNVTGGTLIVSGSLTGTLSSSVAANATLEVDGLLNASAATAVNGTLVGTGTVGAVNVTSGGTLAPGLKTGSTAAGSLTASGSVSIDNLSTFSVRLGVAVGTDNDQLIVPTGTVSLNNTPLQLTIGGALGTLASNGNTVDVGSLYVIIMGGAGAPGMGSGTDLFTNNGTALTNGQSFIADGFQFTINYGVTAADGPSGDDVVLELTAIPEPGTWAMLLSGVGMLIGLQLLRRRRD